MAKYKVQPERSAARKQLTSTCSHAMDIALLNLANLLHETYYSEEALTPLMVSVSISPEESILYYALGRVYAVREC